MITNFEHIQFKYPEVLLYLCQIPQLNVEFYLNGVKLILSKSDATEIHITHRERLGYVSVWIGHCGNIVYSKELSTKEITEYGKS